MLTRMAVVAIALVLGLSLTSDPSGPAPAQPAEAAVAADVRLERGSSRSAQYVMYGNPTIYTLWPGHTAQTVKKWRPPFGTIARWRYAGGITHYYLRCTAAQWSSLGGCWKWPEADVVITAIWKPTSW